MRLWADGVMNTSSGPPTENNNHNKDYNNDDNKKPEMSPATAASGGVPNEHSSTCRMQQRRVPPCFSAGFHSFTGVSPRPVFLHRWRREERAATSYYSFDSGVRKLQYRFMFSLADVFFFFFFFQLRIALFFECLHYHVSPQFSALVKQCRSCSQTNTPAFCNGDFIVPFFDIWTICLLN